MRYALAGELNVEPHNVGWITAVGTAVGAVIGGFALWCANRLLGKAAFQTAINAGFSSLTDQLQEERSLLLAQIASERRAAERERLQSAAERASLRGEIRNLTQVVESLKALLRANGIEVPELRPRATVDNPPPRMIELREGEPYEEGEA
jgi:hypothetical protein